MVLAGKKWALSVAVPSNTIQQQAADFSRNAVKATLSRHSGELLETAQTNLFHQRLC